MEITKRSIPRIASAGLLLGGGCSSSSGHATPSDVGYEFCQSLDACGPLYSSATGDYAYSENYGSFGQCQDVNSGIYADFANYYDSLYGIACGDALLDFYACYWDVYADTCDDAEPNRVCADLDADADYFCR